MWTDIGVALGLVLVIEGIIWALAPGGMRRALAALASQSDDAVRLSGIVAAVIGLVIVLVVRS